MPPPPCDWNDPPSHGNEAPGQIWPEPLDTPGYVPQHLKRAATGQFPVLELVQRLLYRLRPNGMSEIEKILAIDSNDKLHRVMMPSLPGKQAKIQDEGVSYLPPMGTGLFWIGFRPFIFSRQGGHSLQGGRSTSGSSVGGSARLQNAITLTTLGWSLRPLQDFADMCREFKAKNVTGTTTVYFAGSNRYDPYGNGWQSVTKAVRRLDTIDMDEEIKADIVRDAEYYYSDESRTFFADCGIPYRRGYLFHGPPGTGKSSFSAALAGQLRCDIYHISLANGTINGDTLHRLFLGLPRKCIVVIEDIDSAGIGREHAASQRAPHVEKAPANRNSVTLSGLLNAIDGNASQEGRLLIMTSNNPDVLDAALTRPGRVDKKVYFGNMSQRSTKSIFKRLIGRSAMACNSAFTATQIDQWADQFAEFIPSDTFSPAQIQNFLQDCHGDPMKALSDIEAWVANNRPVRAGESSPSELDYTMLGSDADHEKD